MKACRMMALSAALLLCAPSYGADRFWVAGSGDWSSPANWSANSGGTSGATVPGASDTAIFDENSGDCRINQNVTPEGLQLRAGYGGTVTQAEAVSVTVAKSLEQHGGLFAGGTNSIRTAVFYRTAGQFALGAQGLEATTAWTNASTEGFSGTGGTVHLISRAGTVTISNVPSLGNVRLGNLSGSTARNLNIVPGSTLTSTGLLRLASSASNKELVIGGTMAARGNIEADNSTFSGTATLRIDGSANQWFSGSGGVVPSVEIAKTGGTLHLDGTLQIGGNLAYIGGGLDAGTSLVAILASQTSVTGSMTLANMAIANRTTSTIRALTLQPGTVLTVAGNLSYNDRSSFGKSVQMAGGEIRMLGNLTVASNGVSSSFGTTSHVFAGDGTQRVSAAGAEGAFLFNVAVDKAGGKVWLGSDWTINQADTGVAVRQGTLDLGTNRLTLTGLRAFYSNTTALARMNVRLGSGRPAVLTTGTGAKFYVQGLLGVSLEDGYDPGPEAKIVIVTSATPVVVSAPFSPFVLAGEGMTCQILYNDAGNNVVLTGIRRIPRYGGAAIVVK